MSYDDKKFGFTLPTRVGDAQGGSTERQMLDRLGHSGGYRTSYRTNADGSESRLDTRNGAPRFTTEDIDEVDELVEPPEVEYPPVYLESGQLVYSFPGDLNPTRLNPATWRFMELNYQGWVRRPPDPNDPIFTDNWPDPQSVRDGCNSQSIGIRKTWLKPDYREKEEKLVEASKADTKFATDDPQDIPGKKITAVAIPASIYSGKMQLFIQALMGARRDDNPLGLKLIGAEILHTLSGGGQSINLGTYAHNSPGILSSSSGYWLIVITNPTGSAYVVVGYPIKVPKEIDWIRAKALAPGTAMNSAPGRAALEAYMFANCTLDLSKPVSIGQLPTVGGGAIAYGWKWKNDGSEARIVTHRTIGSGASERFSSTTTVLSFVGTANQLGEQTGVSMNGVATLNGDWTDGWGSYNIFAPDYVTSPPLTLFSCRFDGGANIAFNNIEIYGYYKDDQWIPVRVSKKLSLEPSYEQENSHEGTPATIFTGANMNAGSNYQYSGGLANTDFTYSSKQVFSGSEMTLSVGSEQYVGRSENITVTEIDFPKSSGGGSVESNAVDFVGQQVTDSSSVSFGPPSGYSGYDPNSEGANNGGFIRWRTVTRTFTTFTGMQYSVWALAIPAYDCNSVYVATRQNEDTAGTKQVQTTVGRHIYEFFSSVNSFAPNCPSNHFGGWYGFGVNAVVTTDNDPPKKTIEKFFLSDRRVVGFPITPNGSLTSLFEVPRNEPFYMRGLTSCASFQTKSFWLSEGAGSSRRTDGVVDGAPFTGYI